MFTSVLLDMPPSANKMWRKGPFGMHPSAEYKGWKNSAAMEVMAARRGQTFDEPVEIVLIIKRAHKLRDLDNQIKPVLDALQMGQAITDDNLVHRLHVRWAFESDLPSLNNRDVRVEIRSA